MTTVFEVLRHLSNSDRHLALRQQKVPRLPTQTFRRASTVPSRQSLASFDSDQQSFLRHSDKILELNVLQPSGRVRVIRSKNVKHFVVKLMLVKAMMYHAVDRQQTMEEVVATRRAVAVMTTTSRATTEREAGDVTTRMRTRRDAVTRSDDRSDSRLLHVRLLAIVVEADVDARLHADVEKMTACPKKGILLIANIDSELKSTSMMARAASKYFYVASKTLPTTMIGMKLTSLCISKQRLPVQPNI